MSRLNNVKWWLNVALLVFALISLVLTVIANLQGNDMLACKHMLEALVDITVVTACKAIKD